MANTINWGKAVDNNTIDWGKGSTTSTNDWGSIYADSASGETSLESGIVPFDADAQAYFTAVETAGGTLSNDFKTYYNTMILGLKSDGVYSKLLRFNPNAGGVEASAEIDQIIPSTNNINFVNSPTIDSTIGVTFNGANQYATTGFIPSTGFASATNWQAQVYVMVKSTGTLKSILAAIDTTSRALMLRAAALSAGQSSGRGLNASRVATSTSGTLDNQSIAVSRTSSTRLDIFVNGLSEAADTLADTGTLPNIELYYGSRNNAGSAEQFADGKFCFMTLAEGMDAANMLALHSRIQTFLTAMGL